MYERILEQFKHYRWGFALISVALIGVGVLFAVGQAETLVTIARVLGILIAIVGISMLVTYFIKMKRRKADSPRLFTCIVITVLGVAMLANPAQFAGLIPFLLGIYIVWIGATLVEMGICMAQAKEKKGPWVIAAACLLIAFGFVMMVNPFSALTWFALFLGTVMILSGIIGLCGVFYFAHVTKVVCATAQEIEDDLQEDVSQGKEEK